MISEIKNGVILSTKGNNIRYRRFDGNEFDYKALSFDTTGREEELKGQFLQVQINTDPGNYTWHEAITPNAVN